MMVCWGQSNTKKLGFYVVLILILVDDGLLELFSVRNKNNWLSLNPYSGGWWSAGSRPKIYQLFSVSLNPYSGGWWSAGYYEKFSRIVRKSLNPYSGGWWSAGIWIHSFATRNKVLILILVDDGLLEIGYGLSEEEIGLNPYSGGWWSAGYLCCVDTEQTRRLNPYSGGWWSAGPTAWRSLIWFTLSLNPYSGGWWSAG